MSQRRRKLGLSNYSKSCMKKTPLARRSADKAKKPKRLFLMKRTPLARRSDDKSKWNRLYLAEKRRRFNYGGLCDRCAEEPPQDGHHPYGQQGENIMIFVCICRACHDFIHENPKAAKAVGWLVDVLKQSRVEHPAVTSMREHWEAQKPQLTARNGL